MTSPSPITIATTCPHCGASRLEWGPHTLSNDDLRDIGSAAAQQLFRITEVRRLRADKGRES